MKIAVVFGTRPEAIKMAPIINELKYRQVPYIVIVTAQHREMLDQKLEVFNIKPDYDLNIMQHNQDLFYVTSSVLNQIKTVLEKEKPDILLVQGDTTTTFAASLAAFYLKIPVGHVESGLRTWNKMNPYPEEINRQLTTRLVEYHFAPTNWAKGNLLREGISESKIFVTGNTVIDALFLIINQNFNFEEGLLSKIDYENKKVILLTCHRRENFGRPMEQIFSACRYLIEHHSDIELIYPVHPNPNVKTLAEKMLKGYANVHLIKPLEYVPFVHLMSKSYLILTDSGGVQEEAPSLGKPVLVLRTTTERPEAIEAGTAKLVGTNEKDIIRQVEILLENRESYSSMVVKSNPYGDGKAAKRIVDILLSEKN